MEYIIILIVCIFSMLALKFAFNFKMSNINKIKEIGYDKKLNDITNAFPENKTVCETILKQLGNATVEIKESENENNKLTYYSVMTNSIIIANIRDTFTRIQTIAHECIHSIQNKKILLFNFIFSNIYILYFITILILTIFKITQYKLLLTTILILFGMIFYAVRSYLETDAMTKAPFVAREYMKKCDKVSKDELEIIMNNYEILNNMGIPMTNFQLAMSTIVKVIIYCIIAIIF